MAWIGCGQVYVGVATVAIRGRPRVLLFDVFGVTRLAVSDRVDPHEGEAPFCVEIEYISSVLPVSRGMTPAAVEAELAIVVVRVAIDAGRPDVTERKVLMASRALGGPVSASQGKAGFVVVEVHRAQKHGPGLRRVAILAIPAEIAVRTFVLLILVGALAEKRSAEDRCANHDENSQRFQFSPLPSRGSRPWWQETHVISSGL